MKRQGEYSVYAQPGVTKPQRKEILSFAAKEKQDVIFSENSQIQKGKDWIASLLWKLRKC